MYAAAGDRRNATVPATSAGSPILPSGSEAAIPSFTGSGSAFTLGVAITPGITTLTRMPRVPHSAASVFAIPTSPAFAAVYATCPGSPVSADADEITTTRPSPESASGSKAARITLNGPVRFVSTSFCHSSAEKRSARWMVSTTPAFATTASQPPSESISFATPASTASRSRTSKSATSHPPTAQPAPSSSATIAVPSPPSAPVTIARRARSALTRQPVAVPVLVRDVRRVLVPVPGARIVVEVARGPARINRVPDPFDREHLVHERAVRAVDREALAVVGPVVLALHDREGVLALVAPVSPQALPRAARVHAEGDLLVVLLDLEGARIRPDPAGRVRSPRGGEQLNDLLPRPAVDRLDAALPVAPHRPSLRLADGLLAAVLLHPGHRRRDPVDHHVVEEAPLVLHLLAEAFRAVEIARIDRLDDAVHRRPRHLLQLLVCEPPLAHAASLTRVQSSSPAA